VRAVLRLLLGAAGLALLGWSGWRLLDRGLEPGAAPVAPVPVSRTRPAPAAAPEPSSAAPDRVPPQEGGPAVRAVRLVLGAAGLGVIAWGAWLVLGLGPDQWPALGLWLAGGVFGHDALLAPLVVLLGMLLVHLVPAPARAPLTVALIVWGSITLLAVPVLGRFGALPDNPTLMDRPYQMSWWILSAVVVAAVALGTFVQARRSQH
jgi:hypothetical protein